jgi:methylated-DNA-protein-cysteine methyltransferase-like protein
MARTPPGAGANAHPAPPNAKPWVESHVPTPFQRAVVACVGALRRGDLVTYAEVAEEVGRPGAGQAVANVLRSRPDLPWWRVLPADGRLYRTHAAVQGPLLEAEGHHVDGDRRVHPHARRRACAPRSRRVIRRSGAR